MNSTAKRIQGRKKVWSWSRHVPDVERREEWMFNKLGRTQEMFPRRQHLIKLLECNCHPAVSAQNSWQRHQASTSKMGQRRVSGSVWWEERLHVWQEMEIGNPVIFTECVYYGKKVVWDVTVRAFIWAEIMWKQSGRHILMGDPTVHSVSMVSV